ncbi:DUF6207 family protein [Streptomyces mirabilis]|uniref:DUF6207 family protein n=1 Tax=Streptomyces mirabilis TaxID=68239 RepID=UPI0033DDD9F6
MPGLVLVDVAAGDDATALAVQKLLADRDLRQPVAPPTASARALLSVSAGGRL